LLSSSRTVAIETEYTQFIAGIPSISFFKILPVVHGCFRAFFANIFFAAILVISDYDDIDRLVIGFAEAFEKVYGRGFGSLIIKSTATSSIFCRLYPPAPYHTRCSSS
jgi:hypothetical protein